MATRKKRAAEKTPFVQFSKRMVAAMLIFWGAVSLAKVVSVWLNPEISESMDRITQGIDDIATVIVLSYTGNSISEKIANGYYRMREKQIEKGGGKDEENGVTGEENG